MATVEDIVKSAKKSKVTSADKAEAIVKGSLKEVEKDVRKIGEDKWQITGKIVPEIMAAHGNVENVKKRAMEMIEKAHRELWELIETTIGADKDYGLKMDAEHADAGVIYIKREGKKRNKGGVSGGSIIDLLRYLHEED